MERVKAKVQTLIDRDGRGANALIEPESLKENISLLVKDAIEFGYAEAKRSRSLEQATSKFQERLESRIEVEALKRYRMAYRKLHEVLDARYTEDWAASVDRVRVLLFRMATAIGFAAVLLGTSWLAQLWGIRPLLFRLA